MEFPIFKEPDYTLYGWKFHVYAVVPAAVFMMLWGFFCILCVFSVKKSYIAYQASLNDEGKAVTRLGHYNTWLFERKTKRPVTYNDVIEIRESLGSTRKDVIRELRENKETFRDMPTPTPSIFSPLSPSKKSFRVSPFIDVSTMKRKSTKPQTQLRQ